MEPDLRAQINAAIVRAHRSGSYASIDPDITERVWPRHRLQALADAIVTSSGATVEFDSPEWDGERGIRCYIALPSDPSWQVFNRQMHSDARKRLLAGRRSPLVFMLGLLSRLGPFWYEYWNQFRLIAGRMTPEVIPPPEVMPWVEVQAGVHAALGECGVTVVPPDLLSREIESLELQGRREGNHRRHPTVEEVLFFDAL